MRTCLVCLSLSVYAWWGWEDTRYCVCFEGRERLRACDASLQVRCICKHSCRWATCMNGEVCAAATSCCRCVRLARPRCTAQPVNGLYVGAGARPGRHQHGQTDTGTHAHARAHAQGVRACASAAFATTGARAASAQEDGGEGGEREGARLETSGSRTAGRLELSAGCGGADSGSDMVRAALSPEPSILPLFPAFFIPLC